jgi:chemotaxis protein histidine kinase CheA
VSDQQDRILRLFMEEAKEHLDTLENGLVDLKSTMKDPESLQEMFRAAHSVKGGAAMLGLDSIKTTAHRLEDCFKILKDGPVKQVDQTAESLFLKGVDTLKDLVKRMSGPFGLRNEEGEKLVEQIMPAFAQLETHLNNLVLGKVPAVAAKSASPGAAQAVGTTKNFAASVMVLLKEMLQVFKAKESAATRQQLSDLCVRLYKLGTGVVTWQTLVKTARVAIANPKNSYKVLAPLIIKELKDAGDLVQGGKVKAIAPSKNLLLLAAPAPEVASVPATVPAASKSVALPSEPKALVKLLLKTFNKKQLSEIAKLLIHAIKSSP